MECIGYFSLCLYLAPAVEGFKGYMNIHIKGHNAFEFKDTELEECADKCLNHLKGYNENFCASFEYDTEKRMCYLSQRNIETVVAGEGIAFREGMYHYERCKSCFIDTYNIYWSISQTIKHKIVKQSKASIS